MPVNTSPLFGGTGPAKDLTPAIANLQMAFERGVLSTEEITNALALNPMKRQLAAGQLNAAIDQLPIEAELGMQQAQGALEMLPAQQQLAELQLANQTAAAQGQQVIQPRQQTVDEMKLAQTEQSLLAVMGSQPFASEENAIKFYQMTHPGKPVPEDRAKLDSANADAFSRYQGFQMEIAAMGKPHTETFEELDPETFDKKRVQVTLDGNGNVIRRVELGITESGQKALTEQQANAMQFGSRMLQAESNLNAIMAGGYDPTTVGAKIGQVGSRYGVQGIPVLGKAVVSPHDASFEAAKRNWIAAVLRKESGAAISQSEYSGATHQYFPMPGDTAETLQQKTELRQLAAGNMQKAALFGMSPAQQADIQTAFTRTYSPESTVVSNHEVVSDAEYAKMMQAAAKKAEKASKAGQDLSQVPVLDGSGATKPAPAAAATPPAGKFPMIKSKAEYANLPRNVPLFYTPDGQLHENLNYTGAR